jgi:hypothetical protein
MIDQILGKRRHVREYNKSIIPSKSTINSLLMLAWHVTPSKNNIMPYQVNVFGPENIREKRIIYRNCVSQEEFINSFNHRNWLLDEYEPPNLNPEYANLLNAPYVLFFTTRLEKQPNKNILRNLEKGIHYNALDKDNIDIILDLVSLEVGMFATAFCGLCMEADIDISYTMAFRQPRKYWTDLVDKQGNEIVEHRPVLIMTAGKAKQYRPYNIEDLKPNVERIIRYYD